jgi:hypothetical protein
MTFSIAQQFVSLGIIDQKLDSIHGGKLVGIMKSDEV